MSDIPMDTQTAVAVLRELKNCNRVNGVNIGHHHGTCSEETATKLKKAFENHKIQRCITMTDEQSFARTTVEGPTVQ